MSLRQFDINALTDLDGGKAAEAFARHVRRAAEDCADHDHGIGMFINPRDWEYLDAVWNGNA